MSEFEQQIHADLDVELRSQLDQAADQLLGDLDNWKPTGLLPPKPPTARQQVATRQQIATVRDVPVAVWQDHDARQALWKLTIEAAREQAAGRGMTVSDQKPHEVTPVFGMLAEISGEWRFFEVQQSAATVVRVRACWWAEA